MRSFIGTKRLLAKPLTLGEYNAHRDWTMPEGEDPEALGYLVEYLDGGPPNHPDHDGYISWSPRSVFEDAYQRTDAMSFGHAIEMMKLGHRVSRAGWNGKGMWIAYTPATVVERQFIKPGHALSQIAEELPHATTFAIGGHIDMRAADSLLVVGWLASQSDMLANDWGVVA